MTANEAYIIAGAKTRTQASLAVLLGGAALEETEWMALAHCAGEDGPSMYPDPSDKAGEEAAKGECFACVVRSECLAYALDKGEQHGIWGGLNTDERRAARRRENRARLAAAPDGK
jgi:WhiB family redox-sensing transcriptional regulator